MSALTDPMGFKLSTLVETQRGLTEAEAHEYLLTGQLPDLSEPPAEPSRVPELPLTQVIALSDAEAWLAGRFPGLTAALSFRFDPNQPRDDDGKWTDTPGGGGSLAVPKVP